MHLLAKRQLLWIALSMALVISPLVHAEELLLEVLNPRQGETPPIESLSGWPLILRISAGGDLWIIPLDGDESDTFPLNREESDPFPVEGQTGLLVRLSPGCAELCSDLERKQGGCTSCPYEELVEFTPDHDMPGVPDYAGNKSNQRALTKNPFLNGPIIQYSDPKGYFLAPIGPLTDAPVYQGAEQSCALDRESLDGYGFGTDDDLPGLALFSDTGVGVAFDSNFVRYSPMKAYNLAGFFNSVSYELSDAEGRTGILASMVVPDRLFAPLILVDYCVQLAQLLEEAGRFAPMECDDTTLWQIDGGPLSSGGPQHGELRNSVTLRAFLVSGSAPSILEDLNGDRFVGAEDAQMAGYHLLSNELVITFRQAFSCPGTCPVIPFDLNKNGRTGPNDLNGFTCLICRVGIVGASRRLTRVPR